MSVQVTERVFWETWPKIAHKFDVTSEDHIRSSCDDRLKCPITGVAAHLGGRDLYLHEVDQALYRIGGLTPRWAHQVIEAADCGPDEIVEEYKPVRRRLLKYIPGVSDEH
jgi:hypothetical protein